MDKKLQELIAPRWVEEQQGVYIPLIDKVLLKHNVPEMSLQNEFSTLKY